MRLDSPLEGDCSGGRGGDIFLFSLTGWALPKGKCSFGGEGRFPCEGTSLDDVGKEQERSCCEHLRQDESLTEGVFSSFLAWMSLDDVGKEQEQSCCEHLRQGESVRERGGGFSFFSEWAVTVDDGNKRSNLLLSTAASEAVCEGTKARLFSSI